MPRFISTGDGIQIDDMHITAAQIIASPLSGDELNNALSIAIKPIGETWDIYIHIFDKATVRCAIFMCPQSETVPDNWWELI